MPSRRNNNPPPKTMTWGKAMPVIIVCIVFDALRMFFEQFWFFGSALAAVVCTGYVGGILETWTLGLLGTKTAVLACGATAAVVGTLGVEVTTTFGVIMAMAVGLMGWLAIGLILIVSNARIFEENAGHALWFAASLLVSEVPIVGTIPALTIVVWRMYHVQIKKETEALRKYESEQAAALQEERQQTVAFIQARALQQAQMATTEIY